MLLHDGVTGRAARDPQRKRDHRDPHGCGLRRRNARAGATGRVGRSRSSGSGVQGRAHVRRDAGRAARRRAAHLEPYRRARERACAAQQRDARASRCEEALDGAARRLHDDLVARADPATWLARPRRARQRGRLVGAIGARARRGDRRRGVALRRPARVDRERVRRLPDGGRGGRHRRRPHPCGARRGAGSACIRGAHRRRRADAVQVARPRRGGSRRGGAVRAARRRAGNRHRRSTSDPARARSRRRASVSRTSLPHAAAAAPG